MNTKLPSFDRPPVTETVLGVEFAPLQGFGIAHFGLYWGAIRKEYPTSEAHGAIGSHPEQFGAASFGALGPKLQLVDEPEVRCWFVHTSGERLLQLQRDRFIHNWRKKDASSEYPRYGKLKPCFELEWNRLLSFLVDQGIKVPNVTQCEVTYSNQLELGNGWHTLSDIGRVFTLVADHVDREFLGAPETAMFNVNFLMPAERGRLRTSVQHARRAVDGTEVLQFNLTARGAPRSSAWGDISAWFDASHEWVVRGFADLTRPEMHQLWGRRA